jgi:hypothetical protein
MKGQESLDTVGWYRTIREWQGGGGREKLLRLHLALLGLYALYRDIDAPAIRSADTLRALQMPIGKGMGGQRIRLAAWW